MVRDVKPLKIERFGTDVQGIRLRGDPKSPEPLHVRVVFPGGEVDVVRCEDGSYWVHVRVDSEEDVKGETAEHAGKLVDARLDYRDGRTITVAADPVFYHLAVRVARG